LTLTYGEYGKKKSSDFECIGSSRKGKKTWKMVPEAGR
jgi:hypothetical protein